MIRSKIVHHVLRKRSKTLLLFIIFTFSCQEKNEMEELKNRSLKGDTIAYERLQDIYFNNNYEEFLKYSHILSIKYNYKKAYYDTFEIIYISKGHNDNCIDYDLNCLKNDDRKIAVENLKKAIELGYEPAIETFCSYYNKNKMYPLPEIYDDKKIKLILVDYSCNKKE